MAAVEKKQSESAEVRFSHVHLYVDRVEDLHVYKTLEGRLNDFEAKMSRSHNGHPSEDFSLQDKQKLWQSTAANKGDNGIGENGVENASSDLVSCFKTQNRDVVKQLMVGFGFRVTGARYNNSGREFGGGDGDVQTNTRSVLVTSRDPQGVQVLVTSIDPSSNIEKDIISHFDASNVRRFLAAHAGRQGIGVLAFCVNDVDVIQERYQELHPNLLFESSKSHTDGTKVLEVYAYYQKHEVEFKRCADPGTILRFVQCPEPSSSSPFLINPFGLLPGIVDVEATFPESSMPAYCDHWVSNVFSRTEFLDTLRDTLGFSPKVDFNAGVVAAGEAQIESTVTGNESPHLASDREAALRDQSQVYLPINNSLSSVGHVHFFLEELGQGVQHVASRVENLVDFVQRGNDFRKMTGEGFSFLRIPRSYYGILTPSHLCRGLDGGSSYSDVSEGCSKAIVEALECSGVLAKDGAVNLDSDGGAIDAILRSALRGPILQEYQEKSDSVIRVILKSRYRNLHGLLGHHLSEESYLGIVRNQILVDIQGEDILYQIFTSNILQRDVREEAPFFEFIQRVCSECLDEGGCPKPVRPGCGGFGIRNFLTLFLSIEVSKAMQQVTDARLVGDAERLQYSQAMVDGFTDQLNESNPILTRISDAMTEEGLFRDKMAAARAAGDEAAEWRRKAEAAAQRKRQSNEDLLRCSARFNDYMKSIREKFHKL